MKILGLLIVVAIVVVGYCVYNPMVVYSLPYLPVDFPTRKLSSNGCKGPFGIDSQKILNEKPGEYVIGIVSEIDLEKNNDGTWYVDSCKLLNNFLTDLHFKPPYPQQDNLKEGDSFGFTARVSLDMPFYYHGKILENISTQSDKCDIDSISGLSIPARRPSIDKDFSNIENILKARQEGEGLSDVTGVVMAVEIKKNLNPEPENPDDFQIDRAVMKCADGNLYMVGFIGKSYYNLLKEDSWFSEESENIVMLTFQVMTLLVKGT